MTDHPELLHTVLDARDARALAEFYRQLLGLRYREGDAPPEGEEDWLVLRDAAGRRVVAVQRDPDLRPSTWPSDEVPMQAHQDFRVPDTDALRRHRARAEELGARLLLDRSDDTEEPTYVMADPEGHPFCLLVQ